MFDTWEPGTHIGPVSYSHGAEENLDDCDEMIKKIEKERTKKALIKKLRESAAAKASLSTNSTKHEATYASPSRATQSVGHSRTSVHRAQTKRPRSPTQVTKSQAKKYKATLSSSKKTKKKKKKTPTKSKTPTKAKKKPVPEIEEAYEVERIVGHRMTSSVSVCVVSATDHIG